jgi:Arc/MetJ-type ribon-helix-helix transcriptional regulator
MSNRSRDQVTLKIPRPLYNRLNRLIEGSRFRSVTRFVVYVLREVAANGNLREEESLALEEVERTGRPLEEPEPSGDTRTSLEEQRPAPVIYPAVI